MLGQKRVFNSTYVRTYLYILFVFIYNTLNLLSRLKKGLLNISLLYWITLKYKSRIQSLIIVVK